MQIMLTFFSFVIMFKLFVLPAGESPSSKAGAAGSPMTIKREVRDGN